MEQLLETVLKSLLSTNSIGVGFGLVCLILMLQSDRATKKKEAALTAKLDEKDLQIAKVVSQKQEMDTSLAVMQSQLSAIEEERARTSEEHLKYHHQEREQILGLARETTTLMTELNIYVAENNKKQEEGLKKLEDALRILQNLDRRS